MSFYLVKYINRKIDPLHPECYIAVQKEDSWRWYGCISEGLELFVNDWIIGKFENRLNAMSMIVLNSYTTFEELLADNFELFV